MTTKNIRLDPVPNNPAGRLLAVFERMRATRGPTPEFRPKSAAEGWAFVLETDVADLPALFKGIANLATLIDAMSSAVNKVGGGVQPTNLTAWIPSFFRPWQSFNLTTTFDHFSN